MIKLLASLIMIVILIIFHELGHFLIAKLMKVKVTCFSLGVGPKILGFSIGDTEYRLSLIPLGGYISIYGYDENEIILNKNVSFMHQSTLKKILIAFGGPFFNLILPFIIIILLFSNSNILKTPVFINKSIDSFLLENHLYKINEFYIDDFLSIDINQIKTNLQYKYDLIYIRDKTNIKNNKLSIIINNERKNKFKFIKIGIGNVFPIPILINSKKILKNKIFNKENNTYNNFKIDNILIKSNYKFNNYIYKKYKISNKIIIPLIKIDNILINKNIYTNLLFLKQIKSINKSYKYTHLIKIKKMQNWYYLLKKIKNIKYKAYGFIKTEKINNKSAFIFLENIIYYNFSDKKINLFFQNKYFFNKNINFIETNNYCVDNKIIKKNYIFNILNDNNLFIYINNFKNIEKINFLFLHNTKWVGDKGNMINNITYNNRINKISYLYNINYKEQWTNIFIKTIAKSTSMFYMLFESFSLLSNNIKNIGGPITVFTMAHESIDKGIGQYIFIMAFISINLGIMNLFPIPFLDGGHITIFIIEGLMRKSIPIKIKKIIFKIGILIMTSIIFLAIGMDIFRFF